MKTVTLQLPYGIDNVSVEDHGNGPSLLVYFANGTYLHIDKPGMHGPQVVVGHYVTENGDMIHQADFGLYPAASASC